MRTGKMMIWCRGLPWKGHVIITQTEEERAAGMSGVDYVRPDVGMIFAVRPGDTFTTMPMRTPLDMVWIGTGVMRVDRSVPPGIATIHPPPGATLLLEMGEGHAHAICAGGVVMSASF